MAARSITLTDPLDLVRTLAPLRHGPYDPTIRLTTTDVWRASRTPAGVSTLHARLAGPTVEAEAWGPGAAWELDHLPDLLGETDRPGALVPRHPRGRTRASLPGGAPHPDGPRRGGTDPGRHRAEDHRRRGGADLPPAGTDLWRSRLPDRARARACSYRPTRTASPPSPTTPITRWVWSSGEPTSCAASASSRRGWRRASLRDRSRPGRASRRWPASGPGRPPRRPASPSAIPTR